MLTPLRASWRLLRVLGHVLGGLATVALRSRSWNDADRQAWVQRWSQQLLARLGMRLQLSGAPLAAGPVLRVANHFSWLDIPVLHAAGYCSFVSKDDVQHWPLIGRLARAAGTLFIARSSRRDARRMVNTLTQALQRGAVLTVFPEGTTGDGRQMLPFHANMLQAAIDAPAPVQPVGLRFSEQASGVTSYAASYVGDETLMGSVWRTLCAPALTAHVNVGVPELAEGRDRRSWAAHLHQQVNALRQR